MWRRGRVIVGATAVLVALVVPIGSAAADDPPNPSARAAAAPLAILKTGFDAFSKFKTCLKNIDVGQPCLASDSDNIRAILKEVRQLSAQIEQHHKETTARLQLLQRTLDTTVLDGYISALRPEALNGRKALKAWERIAVCMEQSALKRTTCQGVSGGVKSVKAAVTGWKQELITQADLTSSNVELTGAEFTGTEDRGGENGLAYAAWLLNKRLQDEQAEANPAQLNAKTAPVVTRQLAASQNFFVDYYVDVLDAYGFIKPLSEGLKNKPTVAQSLQRRVQEEIYGTGEYSVASTAKRMLLPRLNKGEILYRGAPDSKAHIVANHALETEFFPIRYSGVVKLANAMNSYGRTSALQASNPDSFPDHKWYSILQNIHRVKVCPREPAPRSARSITPAECNYMVNQLARSGGDVRYVGARPVDSKPTWNSSWYERPVGVHGINFRTEFNHFVTGPAEWHWDVRRMEYPFYFEVGPGAWVEEHRGAGNRKTLGKVPYLMGGPR